jgi:hypothetical protein
MEMALELEVYLEVQYYTKLFYVEINPTTGGCYSYSSKRFVR